MLTFATKLKKVPKNVGFAKNEFSDEALSL
jgi:hypothetical protein